MTNQYTELSIVMAKDRMYSAYSKILVILLGAVLFAATCVSIGIYSEMNKHKKSPKLELRATSGKYYNA